ncbi:MAG: GNAT family N-acetyltransferase [Pseudomonadota bacterium]
MIIVTAKPNPADCESLDRAMDGYVASEFPGLKPATEDIQLGAFVRSESGELIGGIRGAVYWDGLEVAVLWVREGDRCNGLGATLLRALETEAKRGGAVISFLKTVNARRFYERAGYRVYGVLEDRPIGSLLFHMKKRLD